MPLTQLDRMMQRAIEANKREDESPQTNLLPAHSNEQATSAPPTPKKPKARSLLPPHEAAELESIRKQKEAKKTHRIAKSGGAWDYAKNQPVTKEQKRAAAAILGTKTTARKRGEKGEFASAAETEAYQKGLSKTDKGAVESKSKAPAKKKKKQRTPEMSCVALENILNKHGQRESLKNDGVLFRPTARALRLKNQQKQATGTSSPGFLLDPVAGTATVRKAMPSQYDGPSSSKDTSLLQLPAELRDAIYRSVVVDTKHFIWPTSAYGREQPDLAMTCRQVREEVLRIYYKQNTFAIDISPEKAIPPSVKSKAKSKTKHPVAGLEAVHQWVQVLSSEKNEAGKWFKMIHQWAFVYSDPTAGPRTPVDEDGSFLLSLDLNTAEPIFEIHKEAGCILSRCPSSGKCLVQDTPEQLNLAIFETIECSGVTADSMITLARRLIGMLVEIRAARCVVKA